MARRAVGETGARNTTPDNQQPNTTPLEPTGQHSFLLQGMMELQRSFGGFEKSIQALESKVSDQSKKVEGLQRVVWICTGVLVVIGAIMGVVLKNNFDDIMSLLAGPKSEVSATVAPATAPAAVSSPVQGRAPTAPKS